jgi:hypothetical protein
MEEIMQHGKFRTFRWVAVVALALLAVPIAQANPQLGVKEQHGQTSQGLKADGMRLAAEAKAYHQAQVEKAYKQEIRTESLTQQRAAKALSQSMAGSYPKGTTFPNGTTRYPFATSTASQPSNSYASTAGETALGLKADGMRWDAIAKAYQSSAGVTGIQAHYPFANENTAAFKAAEQKANASSMPISENSPIEQRLETQSSSPAPISENSPVEQRLNSSSPVSVASSGRGFDYGDAGIGAGLAALLTSILALGAGSAISRKRVAHS